MVELRDSLKRNTGAMAQGLAAALPRFMALVQHYDDSVKPAVRFFGLGNSITARAGLIDPATMAPSEYFFNCLQAKLNRLGNLNLVHTNGGVNGSTLAGLNNTDYALAKTAAGGAPALALIAPGMNEIGQYYNGITYPGVETQLNLAIENLRNDGSDTVLMTTWHPNSTLYPWANFASGGAPSYPPGGVRIPAATYAEQVVTADWSETGVDVPASYLAKRINDTIRKVGLDMRVPVIDIEKYWFRALALYGEAALFDGSEYAHPNDFAHKVTTYLAVDDFFAGLTQSGIIAGPQGNPVARARKINNSTRAATTALSSDTELVFGVGPNEVWAVEYDVFFTAPSGGDLKVGLSLPSGVGTFGVHGPANDATTFDTGPFIGRSSGISGGSLQMGGNGADSYGKVHALIRAGSTGGTVAIQFAQAAASGTTTIYANSHLRAERIA